MLRLILFILTLAWFSSANAECGEANSGPIDAVVACTPLSQKLVYRCDVRVTHAKTGFPLCTRDGTIEFEMPSMPMAHQVPKIELQTDANGEMKGVEVRLEMFGEWRILLKAGQSTVAKRMVFQANAVTKR